MRFFWRQSRGCLWCTDLHVNRLSVEKGEVDLSGNIDSIAYSGVNQGGQNESFLSKLFK